MDKDKQGRKLQARRIRRALEDRDITLTEFARECGFSRQLVSAVIHGERRALYVRKALARTLGWDPWEPKFTDSAA